MVRVNLTADKEVVQVSADSPRLERLDARSARRWAAATRSSFAAHRAELDDLNVFPVPDGDTGTNLFITLDSALEAAREPREDWPGSDRAAPGADGTLAGDAATLARATLLAARGNSGVILSQLVRGLSEVIGESGTSDAGGPGGGLDALTLARALRRASDRAYSSVTHPVEGTILSVAAAAAGAAELASTELASTGLAVTEPAEPAATKSSDLYGVAHAALAAARVALAATTAQLPVLARAGVVDAGGLGYVLVLEALELVITGEPLTDQTVVRAAHLSPAALRAAAHVDGDERPHGGAPDEPGGPAYEVMYLLSDSDDDAVARLRAGLDALGDSVLVVGGDDLWNVHVHVDDVGAAIQAGIEAGSPHRIAVTHFGDQQRARTVVSAHGPVVVVACAAGEGLAQVFRAAGALSVFNGPGRRASAGQLLDAIRSAGSRSVIVLPNEKDTVLAAEAAASAAAEAGIEVHVVRTRSAAQGIAALAVFEPGSGSRDNLIAMSRASAATRSGAVMVAGRESLTSAGPCRPGDILGTIGGDVIAVGNDLGVVGAEVVSRLLDGGGELLTVIGGAGGGPELSAAVAQSARERRGDLEVAIIDGGQATYPLLLGVE